MWGGGGACGAAGSSRAPPGRGACDRDGHSQMAQPTAGGAGCGDWPGPVRGRGPDAGSWGVSWRPLALRTVFGARPPCREHSRAVCALPGRLDAACGRATVSRTATCDGPTPRGPPCPRPMQGSGAAAPRARPGDPRGVQAEARGLGAKPPDPPAGEHAAGSAPAPHGQVTGPDWRPQRTRSSPEGNCQEQGRAGPARGPRSAEGPGRPGRALTDRQPRVRPHGRGDSPRAGCACRPRSPQPQPAGPVQRPGESAEHPQASFSSGASAPRTELHSQPAANGTQGPTGPTRARLTSRMPLEGGRARAGVSAPSKVHAHHPRQLRKEAGTPGPAAKRTLSRWVPRARQ